MLLVLRLSFVFFCRDVLVREVVFDLTEVFNVLKQILGRAADELGNEACKCSTNDGDAERSAEGGKLETCLLIKGAVAVGYLWEHNLNCLNVFESRAGKSCCD